MKIRMFLSLLAVLIAAMLAGCPYSQPDIPVETGSASPGGKVTQKGTERSLMGTPIGVGRKLPATALVDAQTMSDVNLAETGGKVLFLSIVPSIETKVCEAQTHYLGEQGDKLPPDVRRIVISRDTPFAQKRFAEEAKLTDLQYLSDYKQGDFGRSLGLLIEGPMLLARSVILVDKAGTVQYIQVVPEVTHMPDMETAFERAVQLAKE